MALYAPPIDYTGIRRAIVAAVALGTGLPPNRVIQLEPETPTQPRPSLPYMTFKLTGPGDRLGTDHQTIYTDDDGYLQARIAGQRRLSMSFNAYAQGHEAAWGLMARWQGIMDADIIRSSLRTSGIAIWTIGNIRDLSMLLDTAYEGRAQLDTTLGVVSVVSFSDPATIDHIPVKVTTDGDKADTLRVELGE